MELQHEIDYCNAWSVSIEQLKARIAELTERHKYGQPEEDADQEIWDQWGELQALLDVQHDLDWCWTDDSRELINTDNFDDYVEEMMYNIGDCQRGGVVAGIVDWSKVSEVICNDYKKVTLPGGYDYYTRA